MLWADSPRLLLPTDTQLTKAVINSPQPFLMALSLLFEPGRELVFAELQKDAFTTYDNSWQPFFLFSGNELPSLFLREVVIWIEPRETNECTCFPKFMHERNALKIPAHYIAVALNGRATYE